MVALAALRNLQVPLEKREIILGLTGIHGRLTHIKSIIDKLLK